MSDREDQQSSQEDNDARTCDVCPNTDEVAGELYYCQACECVLCSTCWKAQAAHSLKKNIGRRGHAPHEQISLSVLNVIEPAFSRPGDEATLDIRLADDENTAWFGVSREVVGDLPLYLCDYGRYSALMTSKKASKRMSQAVARTPSLALVSRQTPSLVSFVGQTGAGKSTLIKLLIQLQSTATTQIQFQSPVVGVSGKEVPTSEDVHLYVDPATFLSDSPILYADCEGLDGGERRPLATEARSKREAAEATTTGGAGSPESRNPPHSKRKLQWANSRAERTRQFTVSTFYPRLLFTFSDVVVFVHRNPRVIESVLERLIDWATSALETSSNQPILPYAIVVLNASPHDIDSNLWDNDNATKTLFESLSKTVNQNDTFARYCEFWKRRGRQIDTVEQLMLCYYSSVRIVRLPVDTQPNLVYKQAQKLYQEIEQGSKTARDRKAELRMLLDAKGLQSYLQHAFDHYARTLDIPFDFVQISFLHNPIPSNFGGSILSLAIAMTKQEKRPDPSIIFNKLGQLVASCIMLDTVRHNTLGTASHIFPQYIGHLDAALRDFCDRHWPCEYVMRGQIPAHLQAHLSHMQFQHNMRASALLYRCVNTRLGHSSKGHQVKDGRIFAHGAYVSKFSFENNREEFHAGVYFRLEHLLAQLAEPFFQGEAQSTAATRAHGALVQEFFHKKADETESLDLVSHSVCWCCLFEIPEHALSCGHILCTPCIKAFGRVYSNSIIQVHECPFESYGRCQPRFIYIKPETAGVRILVLEGRGVHSIVQLEILRLLEKELNGKIPIQCFFDMIVATGTSSMIALSLSSYDDTLEECTSKFMKVCKQSFSPGNRRKFRQLSPSASKYGSVVLEDSLRDAFTGTQPLFGSDKAGGRFNIATKALIPALTSAGDTIVFGNYLHRTHLKLPYQFSSPGDVGGEIKVWEAARASMADSQLFKSFKHAASNRAYGSKYSRTMSPLVIADKEFKIIWNGSPSRIPDIVLSVGTGLDTDSASCVTESHSPKSTSKSTISNQQKAWASGTSIENYAEIQWKEYIDNLPQSAPSSHFVRVDAAIGRPLPFIDDANSMEALRNLARSFVDQEEIRKLASQLVATLFYFNTKRTTQETPGRGIGLQGEILCRIPDGAPEIYEIGKLFRNGRLFNSEFIFEEESCEQQTFLVHPSTIDDMIMHLHFQMPDIAIQISEPASKIMGFLRLENGEEHSISGFPRRLARDGNPAFRHPSATQSPATVIRRRPEWTPPDLSRYSFGSSGNSLSAITKDLPANFQAASLSNQAAAPQAEPSSTRPPIELEALETRNRHAVHEAMKLQRERDRIRSEEVAPLEAKLKLMEANQLELATRLAGLQCQGNAVNADTDTAASSDEASSYASQGKTQRSNSESS